MAFASSPKRLIEFILAVAATAVLLYFGNGLNPIWPLMWFAMLPVLLFALRSSWWTAAIAAVAAMMLGNLSFWDYFVNVLSMPGLVSVGLFFVMGLVFAAGVLLFRTLVLRGAVWSGILGFPSFWVTSEYLRNFITPHGTAGSLAYSQLGFLPFLQLASVTGPWGMTFLLLVFPAAISVGIYLWPTSPRRAVRVFVISAGTVAAVLIVGAIRLEIPQTRTVTVGLIASDVKVNANVTDPGPDTERLFNGYAAAAKQLIANGAQTIVMPEKLGVTQEGKAAPTDMTLQSLAQSGATVVAGVVHVNEPTKYNEARIYVANSPVQRYDKEHMLPPFESEFKPGTTLAVLPQSQQTWGVAICKDMDFALPARLYGKAGVGLMLVPAWDFVVDGAWHGHIAIMRGVEDGFSIARSAKKGFLTVSDNRGRIVGEVSSGAASFATLLVSVPSEHSWTVYQALGDWFAWAAVVMLLWAVVRLFYLPKQFAN
jgi:apolipoprotein N-acyltransferase